jgi:DNA ligase 1
MRAFSQLLDALVYTRSRNTKLKLIGDYLRQTPDPDRGLALAALTGSLSIATVKSAAIRAIAEERVDPVLLHMSRDYVGDLAETVSLLWPTAKDGEPEIDDGTLTIAMAVERLTAAGRATAPQVLGEMLDHLDSSGRYALLKLATGNLRIGISARLAKTAFAQAFDLSVEDVEEVLACAQPPVCRAVRLGGRGRGPTRHGEQATVPPVHARPSARGPHHARPRRLCRRVEMGRHPHAAGPCGRPDKAFSRTGDDISAQLSRNGRSADDPGVLDGELLVRGSHQGGESGGARELQRAAAAARAQDRERRRCWPNTRPSSGSTTC